jgi:hypothetical protein
MPVVMRTLLLVLGLLTLAYLGTGMVYDEGGFGVRLVVKPAPSPAIAFGGGEKGAWARAHPGEAAPWWQRDDVTVLVSDDWEGGPPLWVSAYFLCYLLILPAWIITGAWFAVRAWRRRKRRRVPDGRQA